MTLRLVIDTTGHGGAVVLARDGEVLAEGVHDEARGYAEHLFGLLDGVLAEAGRSRDAIDAIAVVGGPGSFTGLRIGVMTAKTLAHALDRPLFAAGTLPLIASGAGAAGMALAPAGGGCVWRLVFDDPATVRDEGVERVDVEDVGPRGMLHVAAPALVTSLRDAGVDRERIHRTAPLARLLVAAAAAGHPCVASVDPAGYVPEYVSPSQAERLHGLDLRDEVARPIRPRGWS